MLDKKRLKRLEEILFGDADFPGDGDDQETAALLRALAEIGTGPHVADEQEEREAVEISIYGRRLTAIEREQALEALAASRGAEG